MEVNLTRIEVGETTTVTLTLPEGTIQIAGTPGFVTRVLRDVLSPGSMAGNLVVEHVDPQELYEQWREAARRAGFNLGNHEAESNND